MEEMITNALSAPAETRYFEDMATARIPYRWLGDPSRTALKVLRVDHSPLKLLQWTVCDRGEEMNPPEGKVLSIYSEKKELTDYPTSWKPQTKTSTM